MRQVVIRSSERGNDGHIRPVMVGLLNCGWFNVQEFPLREMLNSAQLPQLRVLLIRDVDVAGAPVPDTHAVFEVIHVLRVAADHE